MTTLTFPRETLLMPASRPSSVARSLGLAFAFSLLIALSTRFEINLPFTPVPITGQTLAVLLCGALLGAQWGSVAVTLYLMEGALGLPVFAHGGSGLAYLVVTPTLGYLMAFAPGAFIAGWLCECGWDKSVWRAGVAMLLGSLIIYVGGWLGLLRFLSPATAFSQGVLPFVPGDILKIAGAAALLPLGWRLMRRDAA